ncbi:MAG: hypothetical protein PHY93_18925 [Bacteriovorax sp.]|nr:hypothetical protein [Bacteriovorax sp.]
MTDNLGKLKEIGIKRRQALLKIISSLPAAMKKELTPMQFKISEDLKKNSEENHTETLESNQTIDSYYEQTNQYIKEARTEGPLSRRSFLQISSFFTATGLMQFLFVRKVQAGVTIPFAFFKQGISTQVYVDDVFSAYTYTGAGSIQTITNGIDLASKGGMVWTKDRTAANWGGLTDTVRGANKLLGSSLTNAEFNPTDSLTVFNSTGFTIGADATYSSANSAGNKYVSWTFRKAAKFFDVVTYTGDGNNSRANIAHSLGAIPGMIIIKSTSHVGDWGVYHRGDGTTKDAYLSINSTAASITYTTGTQSGLGSPHSNLSFNPTDVYSVAMVNMNETGKSYVAYIFAHDTSANGIIQCGSFTTDAGARASVTLGWEPQFVIQKRIDSTQSWYTTDSIRGAATEGGQCAQLYSNQSVAEGSGTGGAHPNATGFVSTGLSVSATCIYLAIRRPNKPPTLGTQVYNAIARTGTAATATVTGVGFAPDLVITTSRASAHESTFIDRLRGYNKPLYSPYTQAETTATLFDSFTMDGAVTSTADTHINGGGETYINHFFKRAPGFFDEVCYTGTASAMTTAHNLGVVPELMIVKSRSDSRMWTVWGTGFATGGSSEYLVLNTIAAKTLGGDIWATNTNSLLSFGGAYDVNGPSYTYVAYLFATKVGISKVGSYTGNGTSQTIACGFSTGARFILIKRTDSTGDWYIWDTVRGITASATDPHLSLNTTAAEVTTDDSIDPQTSGFIVKQVAATNINVTSATYIFLAIA